MIKLSYIERLLTESCDTTHIIYGEPIESIKEIQKILGGTIESNWMEEGAYRYDISLLDNNVIIHTLNKNRFTQ